MEVEGLNIPDEWCAALSELQRSNPLAIIAGGAIRDLYLGAAPKDVDFFTNAMPSWEMDTTREHNTEYQGMQYIDAVGKFKGPIPYNVILHSAPSNEVLIKSFDFGICQIGFDGNKLIKMPEFDWDVKYYVMTLRHTDRYQRSIRRYCRWQNRYDMPIVIPELEKKEVF